MEKQVRSPLTIIKGYFNALPDKQREQETVEQITKNAVFRGVSLWVLIFAIFIASLGLNINSPTAIIGAMLICPMVGPILGMGLAIGINDLELLKRSFKNHVISIVISILTATAYFLITPLTDAGSELLSYTSPTLYDILIALGGGAAGILALATKDKGNIIAGAAIATTLMPPLCTAGYGLATWNLSYFLGAFYLYFINMVFICLATFFGVRMLRFKRKTLEDNSTEVKIHRSIIVIVTLTLLPAAYLTYNIIQKSVLNTNMTRFVKKELAFQGTEIISQNIDPENTKLNIVAVGKTIPTETVEKAKEKLTYYNLEGYSLNIVQGSQVDSILLAQQKTRGKEAATAATANEHNEVLLKQAGQINELEKQLASYTQYETLGQEISKEVKVLFPAVRSITLTNATETKTTSGETSNYVLALIGLSPSLRFNNTDRNRLKNWLITRTKSEAIKTVYTIQR
ncbi:MAG: DUF389 domain-containing protein [Oxalobacter sp.]|jgi:uncharacterized hydrophobic protein (TIGR00271 family)|nr:DUF389 domain-containing protein [Oxalobacter sp.]